MRKLSLAIPLIALCSIIWALTFRSSNQVLPVAPAGAAPQPSHPASRVSRPVAAATRARPPLPAALFSKPLEPVAAFAGWLERFRQGSAEERARMLNEGTKLARQRQDSMFDLIAKDPAAALAATVGEPMRRMLPEAILSLLEHPVSFQGDLAVIAAEPKPGTPEVYREAHIDGQTYEAYVYGRRESQQTKYGTSLIGITMQNRMAVLEEPARILSQDDLPAGARLEPLLPSPANPGAAQPGSPCIVQVAGKYYPVASGAQAGSIASRWVAAESRPGPILEADGALPGLGASPSVTTSQASASHLLGPQSVLVILTSFSDVPGPLTDITTTPSTAITSDYVTNQLTVNVANFYTQASYGKATIGSVDVTPVLPMPSTLASYSTAGNTAGLENDAKSAAIKAGYAPANYNRVEVVFPNTHTITGDQFGWSGLAELGGSFTWINGNFSLNVVAHELGHNFGLSHARLWQIPATSTNPVDPAGVSLDYGDVFDIMGHAPSDPVTQPDPPNPWYLNNLGWMPDSAVQTVTVGDTYRVYRFDDPNATGNTPLALRVNRSEGTDYWVAFRRKYQGDPLYGNVSNGAYIFWALNGNPSSQLIDMNPVLGLNPPNLIAQDAALPNGQTFNDSAAGISFQVMDVGGTAPNEYLDVSVTYQTRVAFEHQLNDVDEESSSIILNVFRLNSSAGPVSVQYSTADGTATSPKNYTATSGTLTWNDGDMTSRTITVPITVNSLTSSTATFTVVFGTSSGCVFPGGKVATVNIVQPGAADPAFVHPLLTNSVNALALQPDGKLVIGGYFDNTTTPVTSNGISRLLQTGGLDTTFDQGPGVNVVSGNIEPVNVLARQPDGKILVAGAFTSLRGVACNLLARLLPNGSLDTGFNPGTGPGNPAASRNVITAIAVQPDGKILVGGEFTTWNGASNRALVRLNEDGTLDTGFTHFDSIVQFFAGFEAASSIALQPSPVAPYFAIVIGGDFHRAYSSGGFHSGIVRLKADGTLDTTFDAALGAHYAKAPTNLASVTTVAAQIDGKILAGGQFTGFNGVSVNGLVRLTNTGLNDSSFVTNLGTALTSTQSYWDVTALYEQADDKVLVGGYFEKAAGIARFNLARFNTDGTLDATFSPTIENPPSYNGVTSLAVTPDNSIFISLNNSGANPKVIKHLFSGLDTLPGVVQFPSPAATVPEGSNAQLTVNRTGGTFGPVSVNYHTVARSAIAGTDYTLTNGTLTWTDGDAGAKTISVPTTLIGATGTSRVFEVHLGIPMGGVSIGQNAVVGVTIQDIDTSTIPKVSFAADAVSYTEGNSTQTIAVQVSPAPAGTVVVPFAVTGTAVSGKAYTISSSPLTFSNGVTTQNITLNLKANPIVEASKTVILTLQPSGSSGVLTGDSPQLTVTLNDPNIPPSFTTSPANALVIIGGGATFTAVPAGNPQPTLLWYKNKVKTTPANTTASFTITNAQLTQAGQYSATATNLFNSATAVAELGVVDPTPKTYNVTATATATLTATAAGNLLTYTWSKDSGNLGTAPRVTASGQSLIIKTAGTADAGAYTCAIRSPSTTPINVHFTLNVIDGKPVITNQGAMPEGIVSGVYTPYPITVDGLENHTPVSYSATGLPAGLVCNATTGVISGTPTVASAIGKSFAITLNATNVKGTGSFPTTLVIDSLAPNTVGSYVGMIGRSAGINAGLGGRFDLTTTATGAYTGTLTLGGSAYPFKGVLNAAVGSSISTADVMVTRTGKTQAHLTFTIDAGASRITTGNIAADSFNLAFTGWRNTTPGSTYQGYQTFSMAIDNSLLNTDSIPQGLGYGSFTIPATAATFSVAGVLADGTAYTGSSSLGSQGDVLIYQALYTGVKGSILGTLNVLPGTQPLNADSTLSGSLTWTCPSSTSRTYGSGFGLTTPVPLTADGGRYIAPNATTIPPGFVAGTNNANLTFASAHIADGTPAPDLVFTIKPGGSATVPVNAAKTTFSLVAGTGAFSGGFTQTAPGTRSGTYKGILVNHSGTFTGDGWFTLPQLPSPATSAILSGKVSLGKP